AERRTPERLKNGFFVLEPEADGSERCRAFAVEAGGQVVERWSVELPARSGMRLRACADVDGDGIDEALISFRQQEAGGGRVGPSTGATARVVSLNPTTVASDPPGPGGTRPLAVAALAQGEGPSVVFEGANNEIVALAPPLGARASRPHGPERAGRP